MDQPIRQRTDIVVDQILDSLSAHRQLGFQSLHEVQLVETISTFPQIPGRMNQVDRWRNCDCGIDILWSRFSPQAKRLEDYVAAD